ncbi:protein of unknown function [Sphingomonas sp. YR710]|uniref:DUF4262 domain-containing protein n=1 Tax=Sphingomonas sp. YR710 TaxID=1882773 RepID=UPI0008850391|nr:DUF4262 domain-containing protein [Sphingomonas sp. YR710]SDC96528.1 protein of unknown function [Sphingomonas sp. YR710]
MDDYEQNIIDNVRDHGWFCTSVFGSDESDPSFSYSVGFTETLSAPEFIIFGLDTRLMHSMLWEVFRQIRDGKTIGDGERWSNLIEGFDCISRPVHSTNVIREYLNSAIWFWGDPVKKGMILLAYQLFWPGAKDGLYPWEPGSNELVCELQPILYLPNRALN